MTERQETSQLLTKESISGPAGAFGAFSWILSLL